MGTLKTEYRLSWLITLGIFGFGFIFAPELAHF